MQLLDKAHGLAVQWTHTRPVGSRRICEAHVPIDDATVSEALRRLMLAETRENELPWSRGAEGDVAAVAELGSFSFFGCLVERMDVALVTACISEEDSRGIRGCVFCFSTHVECL